MSDAPKPREGGWIEPVLFALAAWVALSIMMLNQSWASIQTFNLSDPDDAMRMAQVRDLLGGQAWWDLLQHRINPAHGGALMHWSRLVDTPIATGILILEPLLGRTGAERVVMAGLPPLLGALLSVACALGFRNLPDRRIALIAPPIVIMMGYVVIQFRPLHVDHHGWQILFAMLLLWQALRSPTRQAGALGGLAAAALLSISIEGLPVVTLFAGLAALRWAFHARATDRDRLCFYLAGLAAGATLLQFVTRGPSGLTDIWCDSLSAPYLVSFAVAAVAVALIALANPASRVARFLLLGGAGALAALAIVGVAPLCAKGPFATLDPVVRQYWYVSVIEGQPITSMKLHDAIFVVVPTLLGLIGTSIAWWRCDSADARRTWATMLIALMGAGALSMVVMRSVSTAQVYALPGIAALLIVGVGRAQAIRFAPLRVLASAAALFLLLPMPASIVAAQLAGQLLTPKAKSDGKRHASAASFARNCLNRDTIAELQQIEPSTLVTPIDIGPSLLFWTHHSVVATGHHRNNAAMADAINSFINPPEKAEAYVRRQQADFVVFCPAAVDAHNYARANKDGLMARLLADKPPAWLEKVPFPGKPAMSVWRVKPAAP